MLTVLKKNVKDSLQNDSQSFLWKLATFCQRCIWFSLFMTHSESKKQQKTQLMFINNKCFQHFTKTSGDNTGQARVWSPTLKLTHGSLHLQGLIWCKYSLIFVFVFILVTDIPSKEKVHSWGFKNLSHECNKVDEITSFIARLCKYYSSGNSTDGHGLRHKWISKLLI